MLMIMMTPAAIEELMSEQDDIQEAYDKLRKAYVALKPAVRYNLRGGLGCLKRRLAVIEGLLKDVVKEEEDRS